MCRRPHPIARVWIPCFVALLAATPVAAEPVVGGALRLGESVAGEANWRLGAGIHVLQPPTSGWQMGGELSGSIEAFAAGYGCGSVGNENDNVPAVAVVCFQPSISPHALFGYRTATTSASSLSFVLGTGAAMVFTIPGTGGSTTHELHPSLLVRASYLARVGSTLGSDWSIGVVAEQRAIGVVEPRFAPSIGITMEGASHCC